MRSSGARDRCVVTPSTNNPDSSEDVGQYLDRMGIEKFTLDRHKIVFKEIGDEYPDIDADDVIATNRIRARSVFR